MAGIFAFFIAGIASAFIYAKDTNPTQTAATPKPPVSAAAPAETTGSGRRPVTVNKAAVLAKFWTFEA
jgi:hypothetical protein